MHVYIFKEKKYAQGRGLAMQSCVGRQAVFHFPVYPCRNFPQLLLCILPGSHVMHVIMYVFCMCVCVFVSYLCVFPWFSCNMIAIIIIDLPLPVIHYYSLAMLCAALSLVFISMVALFIHLFIGVWTRGSLFYLALQSIVSLSVLMLRLLRLTSGRPSACLLWASHGFLLLCAPPTLQHKVLYYIW